MQASLGTPCQSSAAQKRLATTYIAAFCLLGALPAFNMPADAQEAVATRSSDEPLALPPDVLKIPGVRADMTPIELANLASQIITNSQFDEAEKILQALGGASSKDVSIINVQAYYYERRYLVAKDAGGKPEDIRRLLELAVDGYIQAATTAMDSKNYRGAEELYNRALRYQPANPKVALGQARLFAATERGLQATDRYTDYLKSDPGKQDSQGHLELARLYRQQKYVGQAMAMVQAAMKLNPENPEILLEMARIYQDSLRLDKAEESAASAIAKASTRPDYHAYFNAYALILLAEDKRDEAARQALRAIELARDALRSAPDNQQVLQSLSEYYTTYQQVLATKIKTVKDGGDGALLRIDMARAIQEQASVNQTLSLHRALQMLPPATGPNKTNTRLLELTAELQRGVYKLDAAAESCRRLLAIDPANVVARQILDSLPAQYKTAPTAKSPTKPAP